jgi:hypothetical protein
MASASAIRRPAASISVTASGDAEGVRRAAPARANRVEIDVVRADTEVQDHFERLPGGVEERCINGDRVGRH